MDEFSLFNLFYYRIEFMISEKSRKETDGDKVIDI